MKTQIITCSGCGTPRRWAGGTCLDTCPCLAAEVETDDHECDEDGEIHEYDLCRSCKDHAGFCSVCGLSGCCGEPQMRAS